jgi:hypothetical protein
MKKKLELQFCVGYNIGVDIISIFEKLLNFFLLSASNNFFTIFTFSMMGDANERSCAPAIITWLS